MHKFIQGLGHQAPYARRGTDLEILGWRLLHRHPPRLMIVDEVHHLLAGTARAAPVPESAQASQQRVAYAGHCTGNKRGALRDAGGSPDRVALRTDGTAERRESAGLREFVVSFGRLLPLHRPSSFGEKEMIHKLMAFSGGLTCRITTY
jgi:hypothetical protein